ncbi:hypothetical protein DFH27DRAFT_557034 [Peziza echinospora]|nr:hypothetical protein DFH27DRAFT_557034 [Peziza echinospora]
MLPTPSTAHVSFAHVYEPAEDSFLLLDTLSSPSESRFLSSHFPRATPTPAVLEVGSGSGIVLTFIAQHAQAIFSRPDVLALSTDASKHACRATAQTIALNPPPPSSDNDGTTKRNGGGIFLGALTTDLTSGLRPGSIDVLLFNPPYVPTDEAPVIPEAMGTSPPLSSFEDESRYLALTYAGGKTGMVTTERLLERLHEVMSPRGVVYLLLCAQNRPEEVAERMRGGHYGGTEWNMEKVGGSGRQGGWEVLSIWRIWR